MRTRLAELLRADATGGGAGVCARPTRWSVVDLSASPTTTGWSRSLRLARLGEAARTVFSGGETVGRLNSHRIVVVAARDDRLARRVTLLRTLVGSVGPGARVWIEGLPSTDDAVASLLDELARP